IDFAQLGRNLSSGHGFSTYFLRPLALTHGNNPLRQPDLVHGPLYPLVLAIAFGILGATDNVVAHVSTFFYLLTIPAIYLLGRKLFNPTVGLAATLIFTFNSLMLEYAISGLHITLYLFLMTCLLLVMHDLAVRDPGQERERGARQPKGKLLLAGALT